MIKSAGNVFIALAWLNAGLIWWGAEAKDSSSPMSMEGIAFVKEFMRTSAAASSCNGEPIDKAKYARHLKFFQNECIGDRKKLEDLESVRCVMKKLGYIKSDNSYFTNSEELNKSLRKYSSNGKKYAKTFATESFTRQCSKHSDKLDEKGMICMIKVGFEICAGKI